MPPATKTGARCAPSITGVAVELWATSPVGNPDTSLVLLEPGGPSAARQLDAPTGLPFPSTCGSASVASGADGDFWGLALSVADVNDPAFGVQVTGTGNEGIAPYRLDATLITVYYTQPPGAPTLLAAVSAQNEVTLSWTDNATDETLFSVERAADVPSPSFAEIGTSPAHVGPPNGVTFHDLSAQCNAAYLYRVRAFRSGDNAYSGYSNTASVTHLCPDLTVSKGASADILVTGQTWTWTLAIANGGSGPATFGVGQQILTDTLPAASYTNVVVTPGGAMSCGVAAGTLTCTAPGGGTTVGTSSMVSVAVDGSSATPGDLINGGSGCSVDPAAALVETLEANNECNTSMISVRLVEIFTDGFEGGALPGPWSGGSTPP